MIFLKPWASVLAAAVSISPPIASAADGTTPLPVLQPTSQWQVDYADMECRLTRNFGTGADAVFFRLARGTSFSQFDIILASLAIPKHTGYVKLKVKFGADGKEEEFQAESQGVPERPEKLLRWYDGELGPLLNGSQNQLLSVVRGEKYAVSLNLKNLPAALKAMQTCHDDLLRSFEIDPDTLAKFQSLPAPVGSPGQWATTNDYPKSLLSAGIGGTVAFKVKVGTDGKPNACVILASSKVDELDRLSCQLVMKRAHFKTAIGTDGQPAAAPYINRIRWQIPK